MPVSRTLVMRTLGGASSPCSIVLENWHLTLLQLLIAPKVVVFPLVKPTPLSALSGRLLVNLLYLNHWLVQLPLLNTECTKRTGTSFVLRWQKGDRPDNLVEPCSIQTKKIQAKAGPGSNFWDFFLATGQKNSSWNDPDFGTILFFFWGREPHQVTTFYRWPDYLAAPVWPEKSILWLSADETNLSRVGLRRRWGT